MGRLKLTAGRADVLAAIDGGCLRVDMMTGEVFVRRTEPSGNIRHALDTWLIQPDPYRGGRAKLTREQVDEIRDSNETGVVLARLYEVGTNTILRMLLNRTYREPTHAPSLSQNHAGMGVECGTQPQNDFAMKSLPQYRAGSAVAKVPSSASAIRLICVPPSDHGESATTKSVPSMSPIQ